MSTLQNSVNRIASLDEKASLVQDNLSALAAVRSEGERSEAERITAAKARETPDPEVVGRAVRRRFGAAYKQRILAEADAAVGTGEIGRILRREGIYSSQLAAWRRARADSTRAALVAKKRGPKPVPTNPLQAENAQLKREKAQLQRKLRTAELMIDLQKKVSQLLGITLIEQSDADEVNS